MVVARLRSERKRLVSLTQLIIGAFDNKYSVRDLNEFIWTGDLGGEAVSAKITSPQVREYERAIRDNNGVFLMPEEAKARGYNIE